MLLVTTRDLTNTKTKLDDVNAELKGKDSLKVYRYLSTDLKVIGTGTGKVLATTVKESEDTKWKIGNLTTKLDGIDC